MSQLFPGPEHPGDSLLHRLDPRAKLVLAFAFGGLAAAGGPRALLVLAGAAAAVSIASRLPPALLLRGLRPLLWLILATAGMHLFTDPGRVVLREGPLAVTAAGVRQSALEGGRLILLVLTGSLLTLSTSPLELADGLGALLSPLRRLRLPVEEFALMVAVALRFVPVLLEEAERVRRAQQARGGASGGRGITRVRRLAPLALPLLVGAFRRAEELAVAMEARGYQPGRRRSRLRRLKLASRDWVALVLGGALAGVVWWLG
ncbi:MAG: energy-coupling factor transporter transmembrane component T [Thermaerobacter sp.]|jgi:energy-coupling factor transport system permease protein|nr:energy-coupling factor transporter transmembrane component T [Thermaerobacter sp.]